MKKILITGGGSGIGLACVKLFLKEKWDVTAHFRSNAKYLVNLQKKYPNQLNIFKTDFSIENELCEFLDYIKDKSFDALINNAALYDLSKKGKNRLKDSEDVLRVNLVAPTLIAEHVFAKMKKKRNGQIVNISSIAVKFGSSMEHVFYGAAKGGLEVMTRSLAREAAPFNVCVNSIRPGVTDTDFHVRMGRDIKKRTAMIPLKRMASPHEIARLIFFLCSENSFITREVISIAGGE